MRGKDEGSVHIKPMPRWTARCSILDIVAHSEACLKGLLGPLGLVGLLCDLGAYRGGLGLA